MVRITDFVKSVDEFVDFVLFEGNSHVKNMVRGRVRDEFPSLGYISPGMFLDQVVPALLGRLGDGIPYKG
jgi:hypothetical protein